MNFVGKRMNDGEIQLENDSVEVQNLMRFNIKISKFYRNLYNLKTIF